MSRGLLLLALSVALALPAACTPPDEEQRLSVGARLSAATSGYPSVTEPRTLRFPADHGPHPEYKHEWWYLTGQLATLDGRRFGFQFTIFREAIAPDAPDSPSRWATNQLYLAHAALTDVEGERHFSHERYARGALGLAGAQTEPLRIWLEDWALTGNTGSAGNLQGRIVVRTGEFGFELDINSTRAPVPHGDRGFSIKGAATNASYYYSYVRLDARGTIHVGSRRFEAAGEAWFDHEWSSSALTPEQEGWDWFSLQLSNGAELMAFRLRHVDDPSRDFYSGTYVSSAGRVTPLEDGQIHMSPLDHWTSERTGVRYPVRWRLEVPNLDLDLTTEPWLEDQEMDRSFRYWEGAVRASGKHGGEPVEGNGYVELAGYADGGRR